MLFRSEASEAKTEHERGDDNGHRLDVDAEDEEEFALPGELVDQRRKAGEEEQHAQDSRLLRKPKAAPRSTPGRRQSEAWHASCPLRRAGILGREPYSAVNPIRRPFKAVTVAITMGRSNKSRVLLPFTGNAMPHKTAKTKRETALRRFLQSNLI